ncbi:DUF120 domain-containing protein [Halopenitus persicus]|uniref:Riboflavin kinase n=1 Tax=Halopenitus persicus TaxID=1048396 RepID=A0A1H3KU87_9EURY|nr:DUF120 domain-containing protein [Halopenitus persicus]SDY55777.1 CTP-dependent riboflavin kinase [Halopenitus persicus]
MPDAATVPERTSPDEIAALKTIALAGGLAETKVSCAGLAADLDASTQTASRRLQRLEEGGLIERDVVGDGQWVRVTDAGESVLRGEYADYRRLFETETELALTGVITSGMGEGRHYITLEGYMSQFRSRLGYEPYPGTLNVELDEASVRKRGEMAGIAAVDIDEWEDDDRTYGAASCYAATVVAGIDDSATGGSATDDTETDGSEAADPETDDPKAVDRETREYEGAHVIVPDRTHHDESQLEVIAADKLREELALHDGETVQVRIQPTDGAVPTGGEQ